MFPSLSFIVLRAYKIFIYQFCLALYPIFVLSPSAVPILVGKMNLLLFVCLFVCIKKNRREGCFYMVIKQALDPMEMTVPAFFYVLSFRA